MKPILACTFILAAVAGCATTPESTTERNELQQSSRDTSQHFRDRYPSLKPFFDTAAGYAVFPEIGKGGIGIGGAFGRGTLIENGEVTGYCSVKQGTLGFQLGGKTFREIIFFEDEDSLRSFKSGSFEFSADASAVILASGVGESANYEQGVAVFVSQIGGAMYEASIGGQKFGFESL